MNWKEVSKGILEGIIWGLGALLVILPILIYFPKIETKYFPVVSNFKVISKKYGADYIDYEINFNKKRDCELIPNSLSWFYVEPDGTHKRAKIEFPNEQYVVSRKIGKQNSLWRIYNIDLNHKKSIITFEHQCNLLWITKTTLEIND